MVTDARGLGGGLGASTRDLSTTLNLEGMNSWLAEPLTETEVVINLSSSLDLAALPTYLVHFLPNPVGSAPSAVVLQLFNPGFLATQFEIHFPNERAMEVPQWADEVSAMISCLPLSLLCFPSACVRLFFIRAVVFSISPRRACSSCSKLFPSTAPWSLVTALR
jgi:hypothetical protein